MTPQHTACALAHLRADLAAEAQHVDLLDDALRQTTCVRRADGLPVDALPEAFRSVFVLRAVEGFGFLMVVLPGPGLIRRLVVPERLALVDVRDMDLDHRAFIGIQRIQDRNRGVGIGPRIYDDPGTGSARIMDPVDQLAFVVRLPAVDLDAEPLRLAMAGSL